MSEKEDVNFEPDHVARVVMLVYGLTSESAPFWCFVAVKPSRYKELQTIVAGKAFDLRSYETDGYGEIVVSGTGVVPPNNVVKAVAEMFGVPVRKLFADVDPDAEISKDIEKLKNDLDS